MSAKRTTPRKWDRERLMTSLREKPGATEDPVTAPAGRKPLAMMFKVMGKMFAIVGLGDVEHVILKCDPDLVDVLKATYAGVGHRSHLDRRFWISVELNADVPTSEIIRLIDRSYDLVCAALTRKQRAELHGLHIPGRRGGDLTGTSELPMQTEW